MLLFCRVLRVVHQLSSMMVGKVRATRKCGCCQLPEHDSRICPHIVDAGNSSNSSKPTSQRKLANITTFSDFVVIRTDQVPGSGANDSDMEADDDESLHDRNSAAATNAEVDVDADEDGQLLFQP